jgi:hypothetical protein
MDESPPASNPWRFNDHAAELCRGALTGRVDVSHPELGLHAISLGPHSLQGHVLGVRRFEPTIELRSHATTAWSVADAYVRGDDLVATYKPTEGWPFSPQFYWQAERPDASGPLAALSLLVSVQTHLLETWPNVGIESRLHPVEVLLLELNSSNGVVSRSLMWGDHVFYPSATSTCVLHRLSGDDLSYLEIMPASDFREVHVRWAADGTCETNWSLFADFLEKGVIWRARLQSLVLPRANDLQLATACCRAIGQRPLPLTT